MYFVPIWVVSDTICCWVCSIYLYVPCNWFMMYSPPSMYLCTCNIYRGAFISRWGNDRFENQLVDNFGVTPMSLFILVWTSMGIFLYGISTTLKVWNIYDFLMGGHEGYILIQNNEFIDIELCYKQGVRTDIRRKHRIYKHFNSKQRI